MQNIIIRTAEESDFEDIAQIAKKCSPMNTERNSIYHIFTKFFQNTVFVAEIKESSSKELAGFLLGFISQKKVNEAYIHLLCVTPEFRGKGIAQGLINNFLKAVVTKGCNKVYLITKPINQKAIAFYEKLGFKKNSGFTTIDLDGVEAVKDYNGLGEHMVVFQKVLSEK